jgi:Tfp pilus assembly protein PilN
MIQFNLLPDVKLEFMKAQRMRRLFLSVAVLVSAVSLLVLGLLIGANQLGKKHLADLTKDIASESKKLQDEPKLNNILTVQNQLHSLTDLHGKKPALSRLFDYLNRLTPAAISISNYTSDTAANTITISGTADALSTVNQYVDTLKFTTYSLVGANSSTKTPAFKAIVLSSFGLSSAGNQGAASFSISFSYDPVIFDITKTTVLNIPSLVSTRSSTGTPTSDLFTAAPAPAAPAKTTGGTR